MTYTDILTALKTKIEEKIETIGNETGSSSIPEELLALYSHVKLSLTGGGGGGGVTEWGSIIGEISAQQDIINLLGEYIIISSDTTIYISPTGSENPTNPIGGDPFNNIIPTLNWIRKLQIENNAKLTVLIDPGEYITDPFVLDHPNFQYVTWIPSNYNDGISLNLDTADDVATKRSAVDNAFSVKLIFNVDAVPGIIVADNSNGGIWIQILFKLNDPENFYSIAGFALGIDKDEEFTAGGATIDLRDVAIVGFNRSIYTYNSSINANSGFIYSIPWNCTLYAIRSQGFLNSVIDCNSSDAAIYLQFSSFRIQNLNSSDSTCSIQLDDGSYLTIPTLRTYRTRTLFLNNSGINSNDIYSDDIEVYLVNSTMKNMSMTIIQASDTTPIYLDKCSTLTTNYIYIIADAAPIAVDINNQSRAYVGGMTLTQSDEVTPLTFRVRNLSTAIVPSSATVSYTPALGVVGSTGEVIYSAV